MKKLVIVATLAILFTCTAATAELLPLSDSPQSTPLAVNVENQTDTRLELTVTIDAIEMETMSGDAAGHVQLGWDNAGVEGAIGDPLIPVRRMFVAIPYGATVNPVGIVNQWNEYDLQTFTGANALMPVQPPREKREGVVVPFTRNADAYIDNEYSNQPVVEVEDYGVIRGQQFALVTVRPLQYNPAAGTVRIADRIDVELAFTGGDLAQSESKAARYMDHRWHNLIGEMVVNPTTRDLDELPASFGYLAISANNQDWLDVLQPYLDWKTAQGWDVTLVATSETGTSASAIKSYIQDAYDTWDAPPSFVLLVGDTPDIPSWIGGGLGTPNTDLPYVQLEGNDYYADAGIGRFSVDDVTSLQNVINKTLNYEQVLWTEPDDWATHQVFMASTDNYQVSEGTHNFVLNNYLLPAGFSADLLYTVTYGATTQDVIDSFNAGTNLGTYSGHGSQTSWADGPPFSQSNVLSLTNTLFPFVQSYACLTGSYQIGECFAETWMRHSSGAFAFMGSSVNSYWGEDDIMEKRVYEAFFDNQTPGDPYDITWINGMVDYSKMELLAYYGNTSMIRRYFEMYNIMGDGSVDLWTTAPQAVTVNHPGAYFLGMTEIEVTVPDAPTWARVCVMSTSQPGIIASGYTNDMGTAALTLPEPPTMPGTLRIVVTGHNIDPYEAEIPLTAATGPYVVFDSVVIDDAAGWNPNGQLDYDETALLDITMANVGVDEVISPTVTLYYYNGGVDTLIFTDNVESYPNIPAGETAMIPGAFEANYAQMIEDGFVAPVSVQAADSWDLWMSTMPITLHSPTSVIADVTFDDSQGGNGNNWLDPGEDAWITVTLLNDGSSPIVNGNCLLNEMGDPYVFVTTDNVETFDLLNPGETVELGWGVMANADCPQDYEMTFNLDVTADHNYDVDVPVPVTVGDEQFLPSGPDAYGYAMYDPNDGPNALPYDWFEIAPSAGGPGEDTGISSDDQVVHHDLPFTFVYYGQSYDEFNIDSNGWISFGSTTPGSDYSNTGIPNADGPSAMVAPYWEDLNPSEPESDGIFKYYDQANGRLIIQWNHIEQYTPDNMFETFQVILYDPTAHPTTTGDGIIQFLYNDMSSEVGSNGTVGVENPQETGGVEYVFDGDYDLHATPIAEPFSITILAGDLVTVPGPTNLTAELVSPANGIVDLNWQFDNQYTFAQLTEPAEQGPGEKPNLLREEDRLQLADWRENGVPVSDELDEFLNFEVYRNGEMIADPVETYYQDQLPDQGEYVYYAIAVHDEGNSGPSNSATVEWNGLVTLDLSVTSNLIGANGGNYTYSAAITSVTLNPIPGVQYWTAVTLPNGNVIEPVFQTSFTLPASADIFVPQVSQYVPGYAPGGQYTHTGKIGLYPSLVGASDSFTFMKIGTATGSMKDMDLSDWVCSGWSLEETVVSAAPELPDEFEVGKAYPNPFNAQVTVPFALPQNGNVKLVMYNVLGQRVLLQNLDRTAGYHNVTIDGSALSSGVYLLKVSSDGLDHHQKVMLLK